MTYPSLKKFMKLNGYTDKIKARRLLDKIKENHKSGNYTTLTKKGQTMKSLIICLIILGVTIGQAPFNTACAKGGGHHSSHGHGHKHG